MSMNCICLIGRLTYTPELRSTSSGVSVVNFQLAVDRSYTPKGQEKQADFIDCVAWDKTAEFVAKYFVKGSMLALEGGIQTRNYDDKNGVNRKVVEVVAKNVSFCGDKKETKVNINDDYDEIEDDFNFTL